MVDTTFLTRLPYSEGLDEFGMAGKGVMVNHDIECWKSNRHFFNKAISSPSFDSEAIEWFIKLFKELEGYWESLVNLSLSNDSLQDNENNWSLETDLFSWLRGIMSDTVIVLVTGKRSYSMASYHNSISPIKVNYFDEVIEDIDAFINEIKIHLLGTAYFLSLGPFIRHHVPFVKDKVKVLIENRDSLFEKLDSIIKKRRKEIEETPISAELKHDMLTSLIIANTERDVSTAKTVRDDLLRPLTDIEIRGNLLDVFLGGVGTTQHLFSFLTYYVCHHPQVKQKMLAEKDSIFPPNIPFHLKPEDLSKLEYCNAIINETGRIMPLVNEMVRHTNQSCEVAGYQWDAKTTFHININGFHSHQDYWSDPEIFNPDRFYRQNNSVKEMHKIAMIAFGGGLRICPGRKLAMIELLSLMVLLFGKYDVELVDMNAPLKVKSGVTTMCEELPVVIKPRIKYSHT
ncbi:cytochrome P450 [Gigaspora margarita]|uniref:Cytochrome P450 n=1 Tax=Gigaspora margarita TaxID=4874 RepID=A0A8H4AS84_GIGMA|nr:cytochrome P450 [Gigaspora margarita]